MGHGKETPRQKMIGMMYLVLTAMLALNVSKEVLNAFILVDVCFDVVKCNCIGRAMIVTYSASSAVIADIQLKGGMLFHFPFFACTAHSHCFQRGSESRGAVACNMSYRENRLASYNIVCDIDLFVYLAVDFNSSLGRPGQSIRHNKRYS